jgi:transposase
MISTIVTPKITVGLDLGDSHSALAILDRDGVLEEEGRIATTTAAMQRKFAVLEPCRVVMEVGTHSPWVSRLVSQLGHEVIVANARKLRMIYQNESKTDRVDAMTLARVGRMDPRLLHPIHHRGEEAQRDLGVVRSRDALVRVRTDLVNHLRGAAKAQGYRFSKTSTAAFGKRAREEMPEHLVEALGPIVDMVDAATEGIRGYDRRLKELARERYPEIELLQQVTGVGVLTALCFVLTLEDPSRFSRSRSVGAYLGLTPRRSDSGQSEPQLRITRCGDEMLRRLLVQAAHYILGPFGPDTDLRRFGERIAARGGKNAKRRAVVAVARKLACLLHALWVTGGEYDPLRHGGEREMSA